MASLNSIVRFLNKELQTKKVPDTSRNGLQIRGSRREITRIGFAVDACLSTFAQAKRAGVDLVIVHHGLLWKGHRDKTGLRKERVAFLKKNKMNLYAAHLPLDIHPVYGNNIGLARILGLHDISKFGRYHRQLIGFKGRLTRPAALDTVAKVLGRTLNTKSYVLNFGKNKVKTIGIVSGGAASVVSNLRKEKVDLFITGEIPHCTYHEAKDMRQNVIVAGHYATETVGVKLLMPLLEEKFRVQTVFLGHPTGF